MKLLGIESLVYGVDDLDTCARFYDDFGLQRESADKDHVAYRLAEGSRVVLRRSDDPTLPPAYSKLPGPREVIWGVPDAAVLDQVEKALADMKPARSVDGTLRVIDPNGIPVGFRVFLRKPVHFDANAENNADKNPRVNRNRKWFDRARPQLIHHVVFGVPDVDKAVAFYVERLGFRISDISRGLGVFMRCAGRNDHHNIFFLRSASPIWHHVSFGVENVDELMTGANHMQRLGWESDLGIGRHRISSSLFYYMKSPAGGMSEYTADTDFIDDSWEPRLWDPKFGNWFWVGRWPATGGDAPTMDVRQLPKPIPAFSSLSA